MECRGTNFTVSVQGTYSTTSFKRADLLVGSTNYSYTVNFSAPSTAFRQVRYEGAGLRLEIDLYTDPFPRWGKTYFGRLTSEALGNQTFNGLTCSFPFISGR